MKAVLNGQTVSDRADLHRQLRDLLCLPPWYGGNLDALHDCLTEAEGIELTLTHFPALSQTLGSYSEVLLAVLRESARENPGFRFVLSEEAESSPEAGK